MKILLAILLIYVCRNSIIFQSNTQVIISGAGQAVANTYPYNIKIPQAPDAIWIWSKGWNQPTCLNPLIIQQEFSVKSSNPITVYMTADNNFTLQIDGTQILRGDNWQQIYSKEFSVSCGGKHTFRITAYNTQGDCSPSNPAGLIYAFLQDISNNKYPHIRVFKHPRRTSCNYARPHSSTFFSPRYFPSKKLHKYQNLRVNYER